MNVKSSPPISCAYQIAALTLYLLSAAWVERYGGRLERRRGGAEQIDSSIDDAIQRVRGQHLVVRA
jgi:hypothetical protein